jgi:hypothetical protein
MKKNVFLLGLFILFTFKTIGNNTNDYIELVVPDSYKSMVDYDESQIHMYTVVTKIYDSNRIKGKVTMISDGYGKIIKIIVPKGFPKELSFENYINSKLSSPIPCKWCRVWWCWMICENGAPSPLE